MSLRVLTLVSVMAGAAPAPRPAYIPSQASVPAPAREFRGVWVATVKNIDWPSKPGLTPAQQKAELLALLDRAALLRLNAVLLQVRPACDAFYASKLEPWSEFLPGTMGQPPIPFYDPLASRCRRPTSVAWSCTRGSTRSAPATRRTFPASPPATSAERTRNGCALMAASPG